MVVGRSVVNRFASSADSFHAGRSILQPIDSHRSTTDRLINARFTTARFYTESR